MSIRDNLNNIFPKSLDELDESVLPPQVDGSQYLINGEIKQWTGDYQVVESCIFVNGKRHILGNLHKIDRETSLELLNAALNAFNESLGEWPSAHPSVRVEAMRKFVTEMKKVREEVVRLLMWEIGKSRKDAEVEFDRTVDYIDITIEALRERHNHDNKVESVKGYFGQIRRSPLGTILSMGPFNYPLNETFATLIPALIMGNTCVVKLPRYGCLCVLPLLPAFRDCFPAGVVNIYNGRGRETAMPLVETGKLSGLAFIGSSSVANSLRTAHPKPSRMRCILGLDAKNPAVILPDADMDTALREIKSGSLSFNGQRCTAIKIVFVHRSRADEFVEKFCKIVDDLKMGLPWEQPDITPLPEHNKPETMKELVDDAVTHGAEVKNKNAGLTVGSCYFPSVVYPVNDKMRLWREEQFGPVIPIVPYDDLKEVIQYVVESDYGQQAAVFGTDPKSIAQIMDRLVLLVCRVNLNSSCRRGPDEFPFTGRKDSAEGTLDIHSALRSFSIRTMIAGSETDMNMDIIKNIKEQDASIFLNSSDL